MRWKRFWDEEGYECPAKGSRKDTPEVDVFIEDVLSVCRKHGFSISHEDGNGAFVIEKFNEADSDWLRAAADDTENPH